MSSSTPRGSSNRKSRSSCMSSARVSPSMRCFSTHACTRAPSVSSVNGSPELEMTPVRCLRIPSGGFRDTSFMQLPSLRRELTPPVDPASPPPPARGGARRSPETLPRPLHLPISNVSRNFSRSNHGRRSAIPHLAGVPGLQLGVLVDVEHALLGDAVSSFTSSAGRPTSAMCCRISAATSSVRPHVSTARPRGRSRPSCRWNSQIRCARRRELAARITSRRAAGTARAAAGRRPR